MSAARDLEAPVDHWGTCSLCPGRTSVRDRRSCTRRWSDDAQVRRPREGAEARKQYHFWPGEEGVDARDVDRDIRLSTDLPVESVPVAELCEIDSVEWFDDWPDGRVMDGMHRSARALVEQQKAIGGPAPRSCRR